VKVPLFWVAHLQSASSLAQQQLHGEYLVVGLTFHNRLELARCCSHERRDLLRELLDWRTGRLLSGHYELRDTTLGFFGIEFFFLVGVALRLRGGVSGVSRNSRDVVMSLTICDCGATVNTPYISCFFR
jgi:hypothetical protein